MIQLTVVLALSILGVAGDYFIKAAGLSPSNRLLFIVLGYGAYVLTWPAWYFAFRFFSLSSMGVLYALFSIGLMVLVDVVYFHQTLAVRDWFGLAFGVASVVLLTRFTS